MYLCLCLQIGLRSTHVLYSHYDGFRLQWPPLFRQDPLSFHKPQLCEEIPPKIYIYVTFHWVHCNYHTEISAKSTFPRKAVSSKWTWSPAKLLEGNLLYYLLKVIPKSIFVYAMGYYVLLTSASPSQRERLGLAQWKENVLFHHISCSVTQRPYGNSFHRF